MNYAATVTDADHDQLTISWSFEGGSPASSIDLTLDVNNANAKLQAVKEHWGKLARNDRSNTLIGHSTYDFFRTGDYNFAVLRKAQASSRMCFIVTRKVTITGSWVSRR